MTRVHYISPSLLPSRSANSVHVMLQCDGLTKVGAEVALYAQRSIHDNTRFKKVLHDFYGVDTHSWKLVTCSPAISHASTLQIAIKAVLSILKAPKNELTISRNLYASLILIALGRQVLFETHQLESGFRKIIQKYILQKNKGKTVLISKKLVECLEEHHEITLSNFIVCHDAAPEGIQRLSPSVRRTNLKRMVAPSDLQINHYDLVCGYFGQLYSGRGIEIIEELANARPNCMFMVFGGGVREVASRRLTASKNLIFMGHVAHPVAKEYQRSVDVLLMPYQKAVSIGVKGHDTARWMSPMKMFEYMAAGVPIISSDLPVLKEVLHDRQNALLVQADQPKEWIKALDEILSGSCNPDQLGENAHNLYKEKYTWTSRASALLHAGAIR